MLLMEDTEDDLRRDDAMGADPKRVIIHIDVDSFEEQVWRQRFRRDLDGNDVPIVVVNQDKRIVSVNYNAKEKGITREGRLEDFQQQHSDLVVIETGERYGKQDTFTPQKISDDIFRVLLWYKRTLRDPTSITIERHGRDEMYVDVSGLVTRRCRQPLLHEEEPGLRLPDDGRVTLLTGARKINWKRADCDGAKTVMEGRKGKIWGDTLNYRILQVYKQEIESYHADEVRLVHGAVVADTLLRLIQRRVGFQASAGIAHNKMLAKMACSGGKPEGITMIADVSVARLRKSMPFRNIFGYGSMEGEKLQQKLSEMCGKSVETMHDIMTLSKTEQEDNPQEILVAAFEQIGSNNPESRALDLLNKCSGKDETEVMQRHFSDYLSTSVSLRGERATGTWNEFVARMEDLSRDMADKVDYQARRWKRLPTSFHVKTMLKNGMQNPKQSSWNLHGCAHWEDLEKYVLDYVNNNNINYLDVDKVEMKVDKFRRCN